MDTLKQTALALAGRVFLATQRIHFFSCAISAIGVHQFYDEKCFLHLGDSRGRCPHEVSALSEH